jgi:DNA adenine methylase
MAEGYPGSKAGAGVWQRIISLMPAHENYFELFGGHGAVILRKRPAPGVNVISDVDAGVADWLRRRPAITVIERDALQILSSHPAMADPATLVYLDPPYLRSTRTREIYAVEFDSPEQHAELLEIINRLPCRIMLSGYPSRLYYHELMHWRCIAYDAMTRGGLRRECLWMNFKAGLPIHDVRYVGDGFRERERIGRKRDRWRRRFESMPQAERQVIREALESVGG